MPFYSSKDPYDRYAFLRWWCQNQWWVQIVVPCVICAGVIGALLYQWNNERQRQVQDKIFETQYGYMKTHPPELDPDLDEKADAWRVIRMKKNDPSMPIPYKKKQIIVKHWKSIIVDMKAEEIQRLHDLLQDQPFKPTDDVEIDISKFDAPWKGDVSLDDMDSNIINADQAPDPTEALPENDGDAESPAPSENAENGKTPQKDAAPKKTVSENAPSQTESEQTLPEKDSAPDSDAQQVKETQDDSVTENPSAKDGKTEDDGAFIEETPEEPPAPEKTRNSMKSETPGASVSYLQTSRTPENMEPILFDSQDEQTNDDSAAQNVTESYADVDVVEPELQKSAKVKRRYKKTADNNPLTAFEEVGPLEDNFLQQREEFIKKALEERNRKIEEFKKSQDPYQFIPSPWKRNPLVI